MAKRQNLLANIDMKAGQGEKPASTVIPIASTESKSSAPKPNKTSLYLPPAAHLKLKELALSKGCKVHDLVIQGIDKVLADNGFPSVDELSKK